MIKLASNYMSEIEELLNENKIEIDFLKYPSLSNDSSFNSRDEFYNRIEKIKKIKPLLYHGILPNRVNVCNENFIKEFDIELMNHVIELSDTKGISLHFDGADLNDSKEKVIDQSIKNIQYLKKSFPNVEFISFENVMGKCNQYVIDPEVIAHVIRETGVDFLYDVSHAYWSSQNRNENFCDYVSKLPLERIYEIHINGWKEKDGDIQSHMMIQEEIYDHLSEILKKSSPKVITLEYGRHKDRIGSGCPIVTIDEINIKAKDEVHKQIIKLKEIIEQNTENKFKELEKVYKIAFENGLINKSYPIGIAKGKEIIIYDGPKISSYKEIKKVEMPFEIDSKTQAAFQPPDYDSSIVVLGMDVFSSLEDMIVVIHEFIHCYQAETCQQKLRDGLKITEHYKKLEDWMWEINHPFPYDDEKVSNLYSVYRESLMSEETQCVLQSKAAIKKVLSKMDFEYMVWQEWVEGYARYIENELRKIYDLEERRSPIELRDRSNWYETGSLYFKKNKEIDIELVFEKICAIA